MRKKFISADFLKIFAVLLMVTDHASEVIIENNLMCNTSSIEELVYWVKINEALRGNRPARVSDIRFFAG